MSDPRKITDITADIQDLVDDAYQRGLADGLSEGVRRAKARILEAASSDAFADWEVDFLRSAERVPTHQPRPSVPSGAPEKVPNGTIRPLVTRVLGISPGITTAEAGRQVNAIDGRVSAAAVTNELNRNSPEGVRKRGRGEVLYVKVGSRRLASR